VNSVLLKTSDKTLDLSVAEKGRRLKKKKLKNGGEGDKKRKIV
jgi:hypothetical protein